MRVIVCGGRDFCDQEWLFDALDRIHARHTITYLRQGGQVKTHPADKDLPAQRRRKIGADYLAKKWAMSRMVTNNQVDADWKRLGAAAGPIRNGMMIRDNDIDAIIAFPGGDGTADMIQKGQTAKLRIFELVRPFDREEIKVEAPPPAAAGRSIPLETSESIGEKRLAEASKPAPPQQMSLI